MIPFHGRKRSLLMCIRYTGYAEYAFTLPHSCSLTSCIMRNAMSSNTLFFFLEVG